MPDTCSVCSKEYSTSREESPSLRCKGCYQGFHQPCLEELLGGQKTLPKLPGSFYWLCAVCSPNYELMTTSGGCKPASVRRRLAPAHGLDNAVSSGQGETVSPKYIPPPTIRSGLPYLWAEQSSLIVLAAGQVVTGVEVLSGPPPPPAPPPPIVRSDLPFLWSSKDTVCSQYLKGECPHGVSGKLNGLCEKLHPKRCPKYMKWGKKHEKGCQLSSCGRIHPVLCERSHDLKCLVNDCPFKLHTLKCVRDD